MQKAAGNMHEKWLLSEIRWKCSLQLIFRSNHSLQNNLTRVTESPPTAQRALAAPLSGGTGASGSAGGLARGLVTEATKAKDETGPFICTQVGITNESSLETIWIKLLSFTSEPYLQKFKFYNCKL